MFPTWQEESEFFQFYLFLFIKGALSGLKQFLATKNPLELMNAFYFTLSALSFLEIFQFLFWIFGQAK